MSKLLKLRKDLVQDIEHTPENGMGYHIVNVILTTGQVLEGKIVINGTFLQLTDKEKIDNNNIKKIELNND